MIAKATALHCALPWRKQYILWYVHVCILHPDVELHVPFVDMTRGKSACIPRCAIRMSSPTCTATREEARDEAAHRTLDAENVVDAARRALGSAATTDRPKRRLPPEVQRGACPSPTTPSPVVLAEAPTGTCSSLAPPRGPWRTPAAAPVEGRAKRDQHSVSTRRTATRQANHFGVSSNFVTSHTTGKSHNNNRGVVPSALEEMAR